MIGWSKLVCDSGGTQMNTQKVNGTNPVGFALIIG